MATRAKKSVKKVAVKKEVAPVVVSKNKLNLGWVKYVLVAALVVGYFWYKTNTWPIVAVVNNWPVTRFELDQLMYSRVGKEAVEALITQKLVDQEMGAKGLKIEAAEIDAKVEEIKKQLGTDQNFDQILQLQGMTMDQLRSQIEFQLKVEKLVPTSTDSAKLQADISATLSGLRSNARVWMLK